MAILRSKKFQATIVGMLAAALVRFIPGLEDVNVTAVLAPIIAYILGQGIADNGKEAAKINGGVLGPVGRK